MIINKFWLKISGIVVLVLAVIIGIYAFWPVETAPTDELRDVGRIQEKVRADLEAVPKPQNEEAEKLYQAALLHTPGNSASPSYQTMMDYCRRILSQYPNTAQAEKTRELLQEVQEQYQKQYAKEMRPRLPSEPAVKKSRPLRRRR